TTSSGLGIAFCSVLPALGEHDLPLLAPTGGQRDHWGMTDDDDDDIHGDDIHDYDAKLYVGGVEVASVGDRVSPELLAVFTDDMHRTRTATEAAHPPRIEPGDTVYEFASAGPVIADRLNIL